MIGETTEKPLGTQRAWNSAVTSAILVYVRERERERERVAGRTFGSDYTLL